MTWRNSLRQDRETLKRLEPKARIQFIWDYYRLPIIAAAVGLALLITAVGLNLGRGEVAMYAVFVNTDQTGLEPDAALLDAVLEEAGTDMGKKHIDITANLYLGQDGTYDGETIMVLAALFGISDLDLFAADEAVFRRYADQNAFADLSKLIEPELLGEHERDLYYYDTEDGQRVLGGIVLHPGSVLHRAGYYHADVVIGAAINGENLDEAVRFIRALLATG
ncbi:MAG: hypothetical protein J6C43_02490 [Oscillospiraceae bacterium]|nr:hypothetical protein [Oscillospiraceae bacterium]MBP3521618.1 hypothetical protein [Oscillospiraceae bacterium]